MHALVVEDHLATARAVARVLEGEGLTVETRSDGTAGLAAAIGGGYDVVVLDRRLPGHDGLDICRALREAGDTVPVLVLTGRGGTTDVVDGLEAGADDYVSKPVAREELAARVRALLRRGGREPTPAVRVGPLTVDPLGRELHGELGGIVLTRREQDLLAALARRVGRPVPRVALLREVWGDAPLTTAKTVDVYVGYLRRKLGEVTEAVTIRAVRGVGYRLDVDEPAT